MRAGPLFRRLMGGAALAGLGFVLTALASLWAMPLLVRGLGLENFAVLGLLMAVQGGLLMAASNPGQLASLVLLAGPAGAALDERSRALSAWNVLAAALVWALGWLASWPGVSAWLWREPLLAMQWSEAVPWAGLGWACQLLAQALWSGQRARQRGAQAEAQQAVTGLVVVLIAPWAVSLGYGVQAVVEFQSLAWFLALVLGLAVERLSGGDLALLPKGHGPSFSQIRRLAAWSFVAMLGASVLLYADRLYSLRAGPDELGAWSVAAALSLRAASGFGVLGPLLLPSLSEARHDPERFGRLQSLYLRCVGILALAFFVPLAAGGAGLLGAWIGQGVESLAAPWIVLLALSGLAYSLNSAGFALQLGRDGARPAAFNALGSAAVGLAVGGWAQWKGLPGAAWMAVSGQGLALLWRTHWLYRHGQGRRDHAWWLQGAPWLLAAAGLVPLLRASGFPHALGTSLAAVVASFALVGPALLVFFVAVDVWVSRRRGRLSVAGQFARLRPGQGA